MDFKALQTELGRNQPEAAAKMIIDKILAEVEKNKSNPTELQKIVDEGRKAAGDLSKQISSNPGGQQGQQGQEQGKSVVTGGPHNSQEQAPKALTPEQRAAAAQHKQNMEDNEKALQEMQNASGTSGQTADPGREHQQASGQAPSGQTGTQSGQAGGTPVASGQPQKGNEPNTNATPGAPGAPTK